MSKLRIFSPDQKNQNAIDFWLILLGFIAIAIFLDWGKTGQKKQPVPPPPKAAATQR